MFSEKLGGWNLDLEEKVIRAKKGDDNAFYELINERKDVLYKTAFTYVKNKEDALDIVHNTVCKAYISIKKLKEPKFFNTWLMRILINCSLDVIRKNKKIKEVEFHQNAVSEIYSVKEDKEEIIDLYNAMDNLNEKYKTIVILKYFQGMTLVEISEILECPLGTVKTNLHKALQELRVNLEEVEIIG